MKLLLSGEGKTDMGQAVLSPTGMTFVPGPMAVIVDKLVEARLGYSLLDTTPSLVELVTETALASTAKAKTGPRPALRLPGPKTPKGGAFHERAAHALGCRAREIQASENTPTLAVLFRDADGTRSAPAGDWLQKVDSIRRGFALAGYDRGVAMVPRPKSEAWLLCALKKAAPYESCAALEEESGNDASPNALKKQLAAVVGHEPDAAEQTEWVRDNRVDPQRLDLPSYNQFRHDLNNALDHVLGTALP